MIDRRSLFATGAVAAAHAAMPRWLEFFFGGQGQDPTPSHARDRERQLRAAASQAKAQGKPLLVFVVPDDEALARTRGEWIGAWLLRGGPAARLDVAVCVPAAASAAEVRTITRVALSDPVSPMLLIDAASFDIADGPALRVTPVEVDLPAAASPATEHGLVPLTEALSTALPKHAGPLDAMSRSVRAALSEPDSERVQTWLRNGGRLDDELLVRTAAWTRCAMATMKAQHQISARASLLAAVDRLWLQRPLPGARWGRREGCAVDIEDPNAPGGVIPAGIECGMGHTPEVCRRFLVFYTGS